MDVKVRLGVFHAEILLRSLLLQSAPLPIVCALLLGDGPLFDRQLDLVDRRGVRRDVSIVGLRFASARLCSRVAKVWRRYMVVLPDPLGTSWMDAVVDWQLTYCDETELRRFASAAGLPSRTSRDATAAIAFCEMTSGGDGERPRLLIELPHGGARQSRNSMRETSNQGGE